MKSRVLHLSEAATVALHAVCHLAKKENAVSAKELAEELGASAHHLSKIMRKLVVAEIVSASKGPTGGFIMTSAQKKKSLMNVFEAIEGECNCGVCIFENGICERKKCIFGNVLKDANKAFVAHLRKTKIQEFI